MSQPSYESARAPSVLNKKSPWNVYTVLLLIALLALLFGNLVLWWEIGEYGGWGNIKGSASVMPLVEQARAIGYA